VRIFVYEFVTGGGCYSIDDSAQIDPHLLAEGAAMATALVEDLLQIDGIAVDVLRDHRLASLDFGRATVHDVSTSSEELAAISARAAEADATIVIAPEFDGHLARRAWLVEQAGGRLLGPSIATIELASHKHTTATYLESRGIRVPRGILLAAGDELPRSISYPAVIKPADGAGSLGVEMIAIWQPRIIPPSGSNGSPARQWRLETYCPGTAASVACLCGPNQIVPLAPCRQHLSEDGHFHYLGGSLPLEPALAARARQLATQVAAALDQPRGYLGIDLVLGSDESGRDDVVIEINPRLTTSYVGLRHLARRNLAAAMLAIASGHSCEVGWNEGEVWFDASGHVRSSGAVASNDASIES
jgi:predicted ATP-grasp superfamily ATP-dependent carboligase